MSPPNNEAQAKAWQEVERLISEQKLEEASKKVAEIRKQALAQKNETEATRALIEATQLRIGLHGYETAVRNLREEKWPASGLSRTTLGLYYANALTFYLSSYSWEIGKREKVASKGPIDLKAWTRGQILAEASRAWSEVWAKRADLSNTPAKSLGKYLEANTYPGQIRGTLRDSVSYLAADHFANSAYFSPEQSNTTYLLDFSGLLNKKVNLDHIKLEDEATHPVFKWSAIYNDLERWHASRGRGHEEAVLEVELERLEKLRGTFSKPEQQEAVRKYLEALLPKYRHLDWWTMGMARLAEWVQQEGDLVASHKIAGACAAGRPSTPGAQRCRHIIASLELPDYQMSNMAADGRDKRSILISHRNLPALYLRAYKGDFNRRIERSAPDNDEIRNLLAKQKPVAEWKTELPATPDYQSHNTFVTPPIAEKGYYIIIASAKSDFGAENNRAVWATFIQTDLVLISRNDNPNATFVRVLSGATGKPVEGASVALYRINWRGTHQVAQQKSSDTKGEVRFTLGSRGDNYFLVAKHKGDIALDFDTIYPNGSNESSTEKRALVFTDRAVYRPLQSIKFNVVAYSGRSDLGRYQVLPKASITVRLRDANGEVAEEKKLTANGFGSASGTFTIPAGKLLGAWQIETDPSGSEGIRVEEYKRPTFEVAMDDAKEPGRLNRPALFTGHAKYHFGLPVATGTVLWRARRVPVFPWWWGWWYFRGGYGYHNYSDSQVVASGTTKLAADGTFQIRFTPAADEKLGQAVSYQYGIEADVTDEGGETRSASRHFRLGFVSVEATLSTPGPFYRSDVAAELDVRRTNLDGLARAGVGKYRIVELMPPAKALLPAELPTMLSPTANTGATAPKKASAYLTKGDQLRPRWEGQLPVEQVIAAWKEGSEKASGEVKHGADGAGKIAIKGLQPGVYRVYYQTSDDFGAKYQNWKDIFVMGGQGQKAWHPTLPLLFFIEKSSVRVGETARFFASTALDDQILFFEVWKRGKRVEQRLLQPGASPWIEVPIAEADRGGFSVSITALHDYQQLSQDLNVFVPWDNKELKLSFSTFRDKIRPGAKETWQIQVAGPNGKPVLGQAAEVLAYMYDRSLDLFATHSPPQISSLYPYLAGVSGTRNSLATESSRWLFESGFRSLPDYGPHFQDDRLLFYPNYGIGGMGRRGDGYGGGGMRMRLSKTMASEGALMEQEAPMPASAPAPAREESKLAAISADDKRDMVAQKAKKSESDAPGNAVATEAPTQLRSNFAETAFFLPHLLTDNGGKVTLSFDVPDSVTSWKVWAHAITKDLLGGSASAESKSIKELMARPYVPRFFREGDQAQIKVVVNNAGEKVASGQVKLDVIDPETKKSLLPLFVRDAKSPLTASFSAEPSKGATVVFPLTAPPKVGLYAILVTATAGNLSDGELRPFPVLPSRMHLIQSRFAVLRGAIKRTLDFPDMRNTKDASRINDQLVVTVDAQLFFTVLKALPYLIEYPYECSEQTLNRFVSTGIVSSLYSRYPAIASMAKKFSSRKAQLETFDQQDPNRKMAFEESPWLEASKGGDSDDNRIANVLDSRIAAAQRESSLARLDKMQTADGGFPWFPGGPPSPYMTLYILHGFAKAQEFGVDVPRPMVEKAWTYLSKHVRKEYLDRMQKLDCCWEFLTFLNYVATSYRDPSWANVLLPAADREKILDFTFSHWKHHSPYLKGMLSLTLLRMKREKDARLVFASVMDSAKTSEDEGTHWAAEDRSWLWYNDTIESHAFALRTLMELDPKNEKLDGLVVWLLLNKKLNQWKSTRATAEVLYTLAHYMTREKSLGIREEADVTIGSGPAAKKTHLVFEPNVYVGKVQVRVPGNEVGPAQSTVTVEKSTKGVMFSSATWHFSTTELPKEARGDFFSVTRKYFKREHNGKEWLLSPLAENAVLKAGDQIEVQLSLRSKHPAEYVHLRDPRAAGLEPEGAISRYRWDLGIGFYEETRDSGANFFFEQLPQGEYTFKYRLRANMGGTFRVGPATVQSMYAPEFSAYSAGNMITVK